MTQATRDKLQTMDRVLSILFQITCVLILIDLVSAAFVPSVRHFCKYMMLAIFALWGLLLILHLIISPFIKSEEDIYFEQKVEYILQRKSILSPPADYTPLRNMSPEQESRITQLLRELPEHPNKPDQINLALIARYLTALEQLHTEVGLAIAF